MSEYEIQSSRSEPAAWASLLELAETAVPQTGEHEWRSSEAMRLLYEGLQELPMDGLNEISFYGHSLAICEVAKSLRDPAVRDQIVERGADALIVASEQVEGGISAITMGPDFLEDAYADLIRGSYDQRPAAERFVGEMALSLAFDRRDTIRPKLWVPKQLREERYAAFSEDVLHRMNRDVKVSMGLVHSLQGIGILMEADEKSPRMENLIRRNVVLSAAYITARVLDGLNPRVKEGELPSQEDIDTLRHRSTKQAALQACQVRSGEFFDQDNPIVEAVDGEVIFKDPLNGGERPKPSRRRRVFKYGLKGRRYYERDVPLVCPAAGVRSMVPLSLDLIGRIVETATEELSQAELAS